MKIRLVIDTETISPRIKSRKDILYKNVDVSAFYADFAPEGTPEEDLGGEIILFGGTVVDFRIEKDKENE